MAGHSKWANIKHKKGAADAKRSKQFTKLAKEVTVAAKLGGGDPDANPRLRRAIAAARAVSVPKDNIERAIKRGTGDLEGVNYEEVTFEGYGPNGVAVLVDCLTDNRNRTVSNIRFAFNKGNGSMGEMGCVNWMFEDRGVITFHLETKNSEELQEQLIEAGVEDIEEDEEFLTAYTSKEDFDSIRENLENQSLGFERAEISKIPKNTVEVVGDDAKDIIKLIDLLEEDDDVQNVYANFDISDAELEKITEV